MIIKASVLELWIQYFYVEVMVSMLIEK